MDGQQSGDVTRTGLVSVITPTFNRKELLGHAIRSVLGQSYEDFELIIIDDGSSDGTEEAVREIGDSRVRYHYQTNAGQSRARNVGLAMARGEFIAFLDSDNEWVPDRLLRHVGLLAERPDYDMVYGITVPLDEKKRARKTPRTDRPSGTVTKELLRGNFIAFNSVLARAGLFQKSGGFEESLRSAEDYDLWLRASLHGRFLFDPQVSALYRHTPGSISTDLARNFEANETILKSFFAANPECAPGQQVREAWCLFHAGTANQWTGVGRHRQALAGSLRAIRAAPGRWRGYDALIRAAVNALRSPLRG